MNDGLNLILFLFHSLINVYKLTRGENGLGKMADGQTS